MFRIATSIVTAVFAITAAASAEHPIPESERWATITNPGNAPYSSTDQFEYEAPVGQVNYEFQISRTEVTAAEWFEFVQAYAPHLEPFQGFGSQFTSRYIVPAETSPGFYSYQLIPGTENKPVGVDWRWGARYCNWLHNNKGAGLAAFEHGVYEVSTFGTGPNGTITDQIARSPGATYFFPTIDEWTKAAFWDLDRYGPGIPGYWQQPNGTDIPLIPGEPGFLNAQTSAGWDNTGPALDVASYLNTQSPWGLFDLSGGLTEWLETATIDPDIGVTYGRWIKGSFDASIDTRYYDDIDHTTGDFATSIMAIRLARIIPSPSACAAGLLVFLITHSRRHSRDKVHSPIRRHPRIFRDTRHGGT